MLIKIFISFYDLKRYSKFPYGKISDKNLIISLISRRFIKINAQLVKNSIKK